MALRSYISCIAWLLLTLQAPPVRAAASLPAAPREAEASPDVDPGKSYDQQLKEYDARMAQQRQWDQEQDASRRNFLIIFVAIVGVYLIWALRRNKKYRDATKAQIEQSLQQSQRLIQQNNQIVELLKSINDRVDKRS